MAGAATPAAEIGRTIRRIVAARLTEIVELLTSSGEQLDNNPPEARVIAAQREVPVARIASAIAAFHPAADLDQAAVRLAVAAEIPPDRRAVERLEHGWRRV